jgi:ABC-type transporter Mla subunit MlaD
MSTIQPDAIASLAQQLLNSANDRDWQALAHHDEQVEKLLKHLVPVPSHLKAALADLQTAHQQARAIVVQERDALADRMNALRDNQEGLRAYEQSGANR